MRFTIILLVMSFLVCIIFLSSPISPSLDNQNGILDNRGLVLGAEEMLPKLTLKDIGININNFPDNYNEAPREPEKISDSSFNLNDCLGVAVDVATGKALYSNKADQIVPIASITKLATALVFLDTDYDWDNIYQVTSSDIVTGGRIYLINGDRVKIKDLFNLSLIGSANSATEALVKSTLMSEDEFIEKMNLKAAELGLDNTSFVDPIGLSRNNVSTALEVAQLTKVALSKEEIMEAAEKEKYEFTTESGSKRSVGNTNLLLSSYPREKIELIGGKTGFTNLAGYCFTGKFKDNQEHEVISVVLGGGDQNTRFSETKRLISWVYDNYVW